MNYSISKLLITEIFYRTQDVHLLKREKTLDHLFSSLAISTATPYVYKGAMRK